MGGKRTHLFLCAVHFPYDVGSALIDFTAGRTFPGTLFLRHLAAVSSNKRKR